MKLHNYPERDSLHIERKNEPDAPPSQSMTTAAARITLAHPSQHKDHCHASEAHRRCRRRAECGPTGRADLCGGAEHCSAGDERQSLPQSRVLPAGFMRGRRHHPRLQSKKLFAAQLPPLTNC